MRRSMLMISPGDAVTPITLRDVAQRVQHLLGPLDVPPDTPLVEWYNAEHMRTELVFEVPTPIENARIQILLDSAQGKVDAEFQPDLARIEIERRLRSTEV